MPTNNHGDDFDRQMIKLERWLTERIGTTEHTVGNELSSCMTPPARSIETRVERCFPKGEVRAALNHERRENLLAQLVRFENERFFMGLKRESHAIEVRSEDLSSVVQPERVYFALVAKENLSGVSHDAPRVILGDLIQRVTLRAFPGLPSRWAIVVSKSSFEKIEFHRSALSLGCEPLSEQNYQNSWRHSDRRVYERDERQALVDDHVCATVSYGFSFHYTLGEDVYLVKR